MAHTANYQLLLASTSTMPGERFLAYLSEELNTLFGHTRTITFIPYARPSGMSWDSYTRHARQTLAALGYSVKGIHQWENPLDAIRESEAFFTGGGNTFALVHSLHGFGLMEALARRLAEGVPYLGCSAGTNIAGLSMQTTNDMPVVYPASFKTMGILPFNINKKEFYICAIYNDVNNPALIKRHLRNLKDNLSDYLLEYVSQNEDIKQDFLFNNITDEEMDNLFSFSTLSQF